MKVAREAGALVHTDATQYVGRLPLDLARRSTSTCCPCRRTSSAARRALAHCSCGRGAPLPHRPLFAGGGQERGWRAGHAERSRNRRPRRGGRGSSVNLMLKRSHACPALRNALESGLAARMPGCHINGAGPPACQV